jgi:CubicO group peptidase (beta-lactamase class C family)
MRASATSLALFLLAGCGSTPVEPVPVDGAAYWPAAEWRRATPEQVGLDAGRIAGLVERLRGNQIPSIHSLLVVRQGYLAVEEYFNGSTAESVHTLQSVTKSVTSLLLGIAMDQGAVASVDRPVIGFFPEYSDLRNLDDRKRAMTLRDILTMRTGLDWSEDPYEGSPLQALNATRTEWIRFVLDWPMREAPGTRFEYNSGGVIVLGGVIYNTTGLVADEFARRNLFDPIGVGPATWYTGGPNGLPHMGGGLNLRAKDMARLGYLVLRDGRWRTRQVISPAWLAASLAPAVLRPRTFAGFPVDYGFLWWLLPLDGQGPTGARNETIYTAAGAQGQWIFVIPKHDLVIVVTAGTPQFDAPVRFLYQDLLPAVAQAAPPP